MAIMHAAKKKYYYNARGKKKIENHRQRAVDISYGYNARGMDHSASNFACQKKKSQKSVPRKSPILSHYVEDD
jgi:hypothetical protein